MVQELGIKTLIFSFLFVLMTSCYKTQMDPVCQNDNDCAKGEQCTDGTCKGNDEGDEEQTPTSSVATKKPSDSTRPTSSEEEKEDPDSDLLGNTYYLEIEIEDWTAPDTDFISEIVGYLPIMAFYVHTHPNDNVSKPESVFSGNLGMLQDHETPDRCTATSPFTSTLLSNGKFDLNSLPREEPLTHVIDTSAGIAALTLQDINITGEFDETASVFSGTFSAVLNAEDLQPIFEEIMPNPNPEEICKFLYIATLNKSECFECADGLPHCFDLAADGIEGIKLKGLKIDPVLEISLPNDCYDNGN